MWSGDGAGQGSPRERRATAEEVVWRRETGEGRKERASWGEVRKDSCIKGWVGLRAQRPPIYTDPGAKVKHRGDS